MSPPDTPAPGGPPPRVLDWSRRLLLAALGLLAALLLLKVYNSALTMTALFNWPFQSDESESMIVAETLLWDRGVNIYGHLTPAQFIAAPYPPLFYLLNWPFIHFLGATFKVGRTISVSATVASGLLIYLIGVRLTRDHLAAALGGLAWGAIGLVAFWGVLVKPDMLAVACGLGGLLLVLRSRAVPGAALWAALPLFWAAFYCKQTAIAAAAAACAWLLLQRWRTGARFSLLYMAGAGGGYLLLNWLTDGGYFYHEFTLHDLPWNGGRFLQRLMDWATTYWLIIMPGLIGMLLLLLIPGVRLWRTGGSTRRSWRQAGHLSTGTIRTEGWLLAAYGGASLFPALATGTLGGNHNHLLDLTAAACLGLAITAAALRRLPRRAGRLAGALAALALCTQVPALYQTPHWLGHELRVPVAEDEGMRNIAQYTSNTPGLVYSINLSALLVTAKWKLNLWTTDPYTQTHATFYHRWDQTALLRAVQERRFALVILRFSLEDPEQTAAGDLSPELVTALRGAYHLDQRNVLYLYKPNASP